MLRLTVTICTHDRQALLEKTIASLNAADRPANTTVDILVVANACSDHTEAWLGNYPGAAENALPLRWTSEARAGKSYALNTAISLLEAEYIAFVDDDHRVPQDFFSNIAAAVTDTPEATIWCGRIHPDWTGNEPSWVHDESKFRIYPLPVPNFDLGDQPLRVSTDTPVPGGGNLIVRRSLFEEIGGFATDLGPHGHDLGGSEDTDFIYRALDKTKIIHYDPRLLQYHYVDLSRFTLSYLARKGYQRSRTITRVKSAQFARGVPAYVWRKLIEYFLLMVLSVSWQRSRFYLVRVAATCGEIQGIMESRFDPVAQLRRTAAFFGVLFAMVLGAGVYLLWISTPSTRSVFGGFASGLSAALAVGGMFTLLLLLRSATHYTRTGPEMRKEVLEHFAAYTVMAIGRLCAWSFVISSSLAMVGTFFYGCFAALNGHVYSFPYALLAGFISFGCLSILQFCRHLLFIPSSITASSAYRLSRLYPLWHWLSPLRITGVEVLILGVAVTLWFGAIISLVIRGDWLVAFGYAAGGFAILAVMVFCRWSPAARPSARNGFAPGKPKDDRPNLLMIGADTLRADRLGGAGYHRKLTPFIDELAQSGTQLLNCHVPLARTAPSLVSLFTGMWPHSHGIRTNYVADDQCDLDVETLPNLLRANGYHTHAISDWSGADLGKINFGFDTFDGPDDQWNLRFYLRQGPTDLRLFLSLFTNNRFGKTFLPEIYYLAGVPLTNHLGNATCKAITEYLGSGEPFMLNVFMATAHVPFGCEYPYYLRFSEREYDGESKFVMSKFADPMEIIEMQEADRSAFDVEQIINLYDSCVLRFDDEVRRIVQHLESQGGLHNTIIVIYSDHGTDFFENGTWGQGNNVLGDAPSGRIPMLIIDPRCAAAGNVVRDVTRSIDLFPTLVELLGVSNDAGVEGTSLASAVKGESLPLSLAAYEETGVWLGHIPGVHPDHIRYPNVLELLEVPDKKSGTLTIKSEYAETIITAKDRSIRTDKWKLVYQPLNSGSRYLLFDIENDPACLTDVKEREPEVFESMRLKLIGWMSLDPEREFQGEHLVNRNAKKASATSRLA
ncbi:MAG: sulfatase-like hydrolase/transferase [Pseudomonadota bacterium]